MFSALGTIPQISYLAGSNSQIAGFQTAITMYESNVMSNNHLLQEKANKQVHVHPLWHTSCGGGRYFRAEMHTGNMMAFIPQTWQ